MAIVGGLDIHRAQITFNYLDSESGEEFRGQINPADRRHLADWLAGRGLAGRGEHEVMFAVEAGTGWRYVAEELAVAQVGVYLAEPADTAALKGPKKRAKTDRADARHLRDLLLEGRIPACWIPPEQILEARALLETYNDLRKERTGWGQRVHAVLFHHGAPRLIEELRSQTGRIALEKIAETVSPAARRQIEAATTMIETLDGQLETLRRQLNAMARSLHGAKVLHAQLYGVGPLTALALTCWLGGAGRFSSARKAVRFVGLDVTVYSSAGKHSTGKLSRQGPPVLRWCVYEAGKTHARAVAPDHAYYTAVKDRIDGKRAAISQARKIVRRAVHILDELGDDALTWK